MNDEHLKMQYMLLDRCLSDCYYFLGNGTRQDQYLWGKDVPSHISKMKELWNAVPEKPEWLSMREIEWFERDMNGDGNVIFVNWDMRYDMRDLNLFTRQEFDALKMFHWFLVKEDSNRDFPWTLYIMGKVRGRMSQPLLNRFYTDGENRKPGLSKKFFKREVYYPNGKGESQTD